MRILGGPGGNAAFLTKDFRQAHNFKDTPEMREQLTRELRPTKIEFVTPPLNVNVAARLTIWVASVIHVMMNETPNWPKKVTTDLILDSVTKP